MNGIVFEMWYKTNKAFLPALIHFKGTWITLFKALAWYRRLFHFFVIFFLLFNFILTFFLLFYFIITFSLIFHFLATFRFTSKNFTKAFPASNPACSTIITIALAVHSWNGFIRIPSTATGTAKISSDKLKSIILSAKTRIMSIYITAISVLVYDGRAPRIHICISTLFVKPIKLWAPPFSYIPC